MARYLDSSHQMANAPPLNLSIEVPSNSSPASDIFYQGNIRSPALSGRAHFGSSSLNIASSAPGIGMSSIVTDVNPVYSSGPQLQRNASINNEPYMRVPASLPFSSQNITGTVLDQNTHLDQLHSMRQNLEIDALRTDKQPRLNMRQDEVLQQHVLQQMLQGQAGNQNVQLNAILQQQKMAQQRQHQILQSMPHVQRPPMMSQHLRPNMNVQMGHSLGRSISDSGLCYRRLMQYMFHQRNRPADNPIMYWRKFVNEYFAPKSIKRWCLSQYERFGSQALDAFPQSAMDAWHCDICGSKSGKGFEATYEVLPRLSQIKFDSGIVDELLYLEMPRESRLTSGVMVLEYSKAIEETVYEQLRVVREGQLRILFTPDLKILSWEFCAQRHEEFFSRRTIVPQVNQLVQVAQKYQTAVNESGTLEVSPKDMQASCNMFVTAGRNLVRNLESHALNEVGFSKGYVRCLQVSEVVNGMKDLIGFSHENKLGAIESLKRYPRLTPQKRREPETEVEKTINNNYSYIMRSPTKARSINYPNQNKAAQANQNLEQILCDMIAGQNKTAAPQQSNNMIAGQNKTTAPQQSNTNDANMIAGQQSNTNDAKSSGEVVDPAKGASTNNNSSSSGSNFSEKHDDALLNLDLSDLDRDIWQEFEDSGIQW